MLARIAVLGALTLVVVCERRTLDRRQSARNLMKGNAESEGQTYSGSVEGPERHPHMGIVLGDMLQKNALEFGHGEVFVDPLSRSQDAGHHRSVASAVAHGVGATVTGHSDGSKVPAKDISLLQAMTALRSGAVRMNGGVVTLKYWNGRFGNNLNQLGAALVFARYVGASQLRITSPHDFGKGSGARTVFNLPDVITLPGTADRRLLDRCKGVNADEAAAGTFSWWHIKCERVPAHIYREELTKHILPYLSKESQQCINHGATDEKEKTLTVHLRVGDIVDPSFPCSMLYKIYDAGRYEKMVIVKGKGDHPCTTTSDHVKRQIQNTCCNNVAIDFCTLMKATRLVVGWSTFSEMVALMSNRVQHVYHGGYDWEPHWRLKGINWCTNNERMLWPGGPILQQFGYPEYNNRSNVGEQLSFPEDKIIGMDNVKCVL